MKNNQGSGAELKVQITLHESWDFDLIRVAGERLTGHALDKVFQRSEGDVGPDVLLHAVRVSSPLAQVTTFTARQVQHP